MKASFKDLFKIGAGPIALVLVARVAVAVGVPLLGCLLMDRPLPAVVAGATAMLGALLTVLPG